MTIIVWCLLILSSCILQHHVQASHPEVFTLHVLPEQQAVAMAEDQGRTLLESGRLSRYTCTSLDGPDCGVINGHHKLDLQAVLESMLERIGSSKKATSSSSSSSSTSTDTTSTTTTSGENTDTEAEEIDGEPQTGTTLSFDQLAAINSALSKKLKQLFATADADADGDDDGGEIHPDDVIEMRVVNSDGSIDLSEHSNDGDSDGDGDTTVHAFSVGADGVTHTITPQELQQLMRAANILQKQHMQQHGEHGEEEGQDEEEGEEEEHGQRTARPTRMTQAQMDEYEQQQQQQSHDDDEDSEHR